MILENVVVGVDSKGKELHCGDICEFIPMPTEELYLSDRPDMVMDYPTEKVEKGMIFYREDFFFFSFATLDGRYYPMHIVKKGSISKLYKVTDKRVSQKWEGVLNHCKERFNDFPMNSIGVMDVRSFEQKFVELEREPFLFTHERMRKRRELREQMEELSRPLRCGDLCKFRISTGQATPEMLAQGKLVSVEKTGMVTYDAETFVYVFTCLGEKEKFPIAKVLPLTTQKVDGCYPGKYLYIKDSEVWQNLYESEQEKSFGFYK